MQRLPINRRPVFYRCWTCDNFFPAFQEEGQARVHANCRECSREVWYWYGRPGPAPGLSGFFRQLQDMQRQFDGGSIQPLPSQDWVNADFDMKRAYAKWFAAHNRGTMPA